MARGAQREACLHFVVVGGGYTGVELAGQLADLFSKDFRRLYPEILTAEPRITLVQKGSRILPTLTEASSAKALKRLQKMGVSVLLDTAVTAVGDSTVMLKNGQTLAAGSIVWASGVMANGEEFFNHELLQKGRVMVKSTLQIPGHPEAFVVGDLAGVTEGNGPHPQTAQAAFEQAKMLAKNLKKLVAGEPLSAFYYRHKGDLVPIGDRWAIAEVFGLRFSGFFGWWLRRTIYLQGLFSWVDRLQVVSDWTIRLFTQRDTTRL